MKQRDLTTKKHINQPQVVLNLIAAVVFLGALMEIGTPQPEIMGRLELNCPVIETQQRCYWAVK